MPKAIRHHKTDPAKIVRRKPTRTIREHIFDDGKYIFRIEQLHSGDDWALSVRHNNIWTTIDFYDHELTRSEIEAIYNELPY